MRYIFVQHIFEYDVWNKFEFKKKHLVVEKKFSILLFSIFFDLNANEIGKKSYKLSRTPVFF